MSRALLVLGLALVGCPQPARERSDASDVAEPEDPQRLLGKCRAFTDADSPNLDWERAVRTCARVAQLDPTREEARLLASRARQELAWEALLKEARQRLESNQEEALQLLLRIDRSSVAWPRAARDFQRGAGRLIERSDALCRAELDAGRFREALPACQRAIELTCHRPGGPSPDSKARFERAARGTGRPLDVRCPPEYAELQTHSEPAPSPEVAAVIERMEREAERLMAEKPGCDSYSYAASITRPDSVPHQKAVETSKRNACSAE